MALTSGTKLGPYEIVAPLGAGGMGEVYRARDSRLGRDVAIKVLPQHLSSNPDLKARFEREAKAISSLNHPHVCHLYDVGSQDGTDYLVMELLEGESLDRRLEKGPLSLKQALEVGIQIGEALEKAHKQGILHRDLKPANIILTKSGAKLLDFGLAKPSVAAVSAVASSASGRLTPSTPTMSVGAINSMGEGLTQQGTVVGTYQYMAPEVLQGHDADARSDLFSFGCLLYEMVTGRRAFNGKSQLSVLTAILEKDPEPVSTIQPATPPALDYAIRISLEKDPENRFQSAHDLRVQLAWIASAGSQMGTPVQSERRRAWNPNFLGAAALAVLAAAALAIWFRPQPTRRVLQSSLLPPEGTHFAPMYRNGSPALSPDGTRIAFVASRDGKTSLWVRSLDKVEATELPGTDGAYFPFWSPDSRSLGFFTSGKLWRADANGSSRVPICNAPEGRGASWGPGNEIVFDGDGNTMTRVSAEGGTPAAVTSTKYAAQLSWSDRWPFVLPDGKHVLYLHSPAGAGSDRNEIAYTSLDGKTNKTLLKGRYYVPQYALGWLLVVSNGTLIAQRFDPAHGELSGEAMQIADNVQVDDNTGSSIFSVSQNGMLVFLRGTGKGGSLYHVWLDATGKLLAQASETGVYGATRVSPDGTKFVSQLYDPRGTINISLWDLKGGTRTQISSGRITDTPVWSRDGNTLYYAYSGDESPVQIYGRPIDGSRPQQLLITTPGDAFPTDVSEDGKWLLYQETIRDGPQFSMLKALPLGGERQPILVLDKIDSLTNAVLMPGGGAWLAYQSSESGQAEVYLTRFLNPGARYQVSEAGGFQRVWARDGKRLYYLDPGKKLIAADIRTEQDLVQVVSRKTLFQTTVTVSFDEAAYDVTRDGRFLMLNFLTDTPSPMTLVTNWDTELKK